MRDQPRVCVFAPAPLLTVTIERPSTDRGDGEVHLHPGGQGFWIARMLGRLDVDVVLCAAFGGETGPILRRMMADVVPHDLYRRLTVDIRANGGRVVADLSGARLAAVVEGGVDVLPDTFALDIR